ncbi:MAG: FHA domain-containing protein [Actinomycetota bacterium]
MTAPARIRRAADGQHHILDQPVTVIGRDRSQPVCLPVAAISRAHAQIERTTHGYLIRDLGSRNGTFVNGDRVDEDGQPLRDGDQIVVAGVETLSFLDPMATPAAPAIGRLTGVWIDPETRAVWVDAQPMEPPLSERQQALLELLDARAGSIVSREDIVAVVWADVAAEGVSAEAIDALVKRLKARLRPLQIHDDYIEVRRGRGLRLKADDRSASG